MGREGVVTNYQASLQSWREHKITEFDVFSHEVRELMQVNIDFKNELQGLEYQPTIIWREFWVPSDK